MIEEFRRYNKRFEVSNLGNVKKDGEIITPNKDEYYYYVVDGRKQIRVHLMVGKCFPDICGEPIKYGHYHHINRDQLDNRAENIRSISNSEHRKLHQKEDGVSTPVKAYDKEGNLVGKWDSKTQAAEATGVDYRHITTIVNGNTNRYTAGKLYWFKQEVPEQECREMIEQGIAEKRSHYGRKSA